MSGHRQRLEYLTIRTESDVGVARIRAHRLAIDEGFSVVEAGALATAVSELARNALVHGAGGAVALRLISDEARTGIAVVVRDEGPGIVDTERAMLDGYSTTDTLGLGLPSARRLLDEFDLLSVAGVGTTVTGVKWRS